MHRRRARLASRGGPLLALVILAAACSAGKVTTSGSPSSPARPVALRLGYEPDLAEAAAVVGVRNGVFPLGLGPSVSFSATSYDSGVDAMGAMRSGALDAAYVDPDPAIATFLATSGGIRIIAGAASGGAFLMTKYAIKVPSDFGGQKVASPGAGSTGDVDLRVWLKSQGLNPNAGGNVAVVPTANKASLQKFQQGGVGAAWVPEPWASRLQVEGNAKLFLDEATLWPNGQYPSAVLVVRTEFLRAHPDVVSNLLIGHVAATDLVRSKAAKVQADAAAAIKTLTGQTLSQAVSDLAWNHLTFTDDPLGAAVRTDAARAQQVGAVPSTNISGIFDLTALNAILKSVNDPEVSAG